jgi:tryptophan 2,3-dioxygenase
MMSAEFRGVSIVQSERTVVRQSSRNATSPGVLEAWLSRAAHDELELLVAHQAHELWFNQLLCELAVLIADLDRDGLAAASRTLQRATRIASVLVEQMQALDARARRVRVAALRAHPSGTERDPLRRLERIAGSGTPALGRWVARERRPERPRSGSVREAFVRAVLRAPSAPCGEVEVSLSRTLSVEELQVWLGARLAHPALAARGELALGLRALDERLAIWATHRQAFGRAAAGEGSAPAPLRRFFPELGR